jgi:hypothetical protein
MIKQITPFIVFGYSRPDSLDMCLTAIKDLELDFKPNVRVYIDGPPEPSMNQIVNKSVQVAEKYSKYFNLSVQKANKNLGLANSIISGINSAFEEYDQIIVLEDDIIITKSFYNFVINGLELYRKDQRVASIHGYTPPITFNDYQPFFLKGADCWGWATWKDRWEEVCFDSNQLILKINQSKLVKEFSLDYSFPYLGMLQNQANGKIDSWAIRWHASMFTQGRLTLYPPISLVTNIGFDGSGTNFVSENKSFKVQGKEIPYSFDNPGLVLESFSAKQKFKKFYIKNLGYKGRIKRCIGLVFRINSLLLK